MSDLSTKIKVSKEKEIQMFKKIAQLHQRLVQDFVYGTIGIWLLIVASVLNLTLALVLAYNV